MIIPGVDELVEASKISMNDAIFQFRPRSGNQWKHFFTMQEIIAGGGVKDFYRPIMDPGLKNAEIAFEPGLPVAREETFDFWEGLFKRIHQYEVGTMEEHRCFLTVCMKEELASGKKIEDIWTAFFDDSKDIGHYRDSANRNKHLNYEPTGCRKLGRFYDFGNCFKFMKDSNSDDYWLSGGECFFTGKEGPVGTYEYVPKEKFKTNTPWAVPFLVKRT